MIFYGAIKPYFTTFFIFLFPNLSVFSEPGFVARGHECGFLSDVPSDSYIELFAVFRKGFIRHPQY